MKYLFYSLAIIFFVGCKRGEDKNELKNEGNRGGVQDTSLIATSANLFYTTEHYADALRDYERLIKIDSLDGQYQYRAAVCLAMLKRPEEAVKKFDRAAKLNYRTFDSYEALGLTYFIVLLNDSLALFYFEKAQQIKYDQEIAKLINELNAKKTVNRKK